MEYILVSKSLCVILSNRPVLKTQKSFEYLELIRLKFMHSVSLCPNIFKNEEGPLE